VAEPRLGLRANAAQFSLLVGINALVGAMVGIERSVLPVIGSDEFGLASKSAVLSFVVAFGVAKAVANLAAGRLSSRIGRRRVLLAGWLLALPVAPLVALAPSWGWVVAANLFLGASQGLAWSMTVVMKIDLVGRGRRGLALGLNESAGYLGVAVAALATGALAASFAPRSVVWVLAGVLTIVGFALTAVLVRDTRGHVEVEERGASEPRPASRAVLRACAQAGLVNNLNDALAWGLVPLYLAAAGAGATEIGVVAALYPAVWATGQVPAGWLSDHVGRKQPIVAGMLVQAAALGLLASSGGELAGAAGAAVALGLGTALVYPTLLAAVSDEVRPVERARAIGVYRFWRDSGFVVGGILAGAAADAMGMSTAIGVVAVVTALSGLWVAGVGYQPREHRRYGWEST
jgi:MFS family permease